MTPKEKAEERDFLKRIKELQMDFGMFLLGEIWKGRLEKSYCWYYKNKKVTIVDLHKIWERKK